MSKGLALMLVLVSQTAIYTIAAKAALYSVEVPENSWTAKASGIYCVIEGLIA